MAAETRERNGRRRGLFAPRSAEGGRNARRGQPDHGYPSHHGRPEQAASHERTSEPERAASREQQAGPGKPGQGAGGAADHEAFQVVSRHATSEGLVVYLRDGGGALHVKLFPWGGESGRVLAGGGAARENRLRLVHGA
jgi:hypothetical protein